MVLESDYFYDLGGLDESSEVAALVFCINQVLMDNALNRLCELLNGRVPGVSGELDWELRRVDNGTGNDLFQASVDPNEFYLKHPSVTVAWPVLVEYLRRGIAAYMVRHPENVTASTQVLGTIELAP